MGLIFRLIIYTFESLFNFFTESFNLLSDQKLRKDIIKVQDLDIYTLNKNEADKEFKKRFKVFALILDKNHNFFKEYVENKSNNEHIWDGLSRKYLNFNDPIFNKRALRVCTAEELYFFSMNLGVLFYRVVMLENNSKN